MSTLIRNLRNLTLLTLVAIAGMLMFARETRPAHASTTELFITKDASCSDATRVTAVVSLIAGPATDLYLCTKAIDDPYGAAAFTLDLSYTSWLVGVQSASIDDSAFLPTNRGLAKQWLGSTGRAVSCAPFEIAPNLDTGQGRVDGGCSTLSPPPPLGADTSAGPTTLAKITITAGLTKATTSIDFRNGGCSTCGTVLVSANFLGGPNPAIPIPATAPLLPVWIAPCADLTGAGGLPDHFVTLQDILFEAARYGWNSAHSGWTSNWDMDGNNTITLQDILIMAKEYGFHC